MTKFFVTLGVIIYIAFALWLIALIYSRITARKIMREERNKKSFTYRYLCSRYSKRNTVRGVKLLIRSKDNPQGRFIADIGLVFVNKGGVMVIETIPGSGFIDMTPGGQWNRIINDKYYTFDDPFLRNKKKTETMKRFLRSEGVENIPVHSVVFFSGNNVKFSKRINGLVNANTLVPYLNDINRDKFLTGKEIRRVVKLLRQKSA